MFSAARDSTPIITPYVRSLRAPGAGIAELGGTANPDPWNDSTGTYALWTSTNVGEAMPDVLTPASWSMVELFLRDTMATSSIPPWVAYGRIGGRVYLNVSVMFGLAGALGVSERRMRRLSAEVLGCIPDDVGVPPLVASRFAVLRSTIPVAISVQHRARLDSKRLGAYLAGHPALCRERRSTILGIEDPRELAALWEGVLAPEFHTVNWMLSAATRSSGLSFVRTHQRLSTLIGEADANAILTGLGGAGGDLASLGLLRGLTELAEGAISREEFNFTYGHRSPHEFELSDPRPAEDPSWLDEQLRQQRAAGVIYRDLLAGQQKAREAAWRRLRREHPRDSRQLDRQIATWGRIGRRREEARSEIIRYFWVLREYVCRAGQLTGLGEDIFFLDADQIRSVLRGGVVDRRAIADNRRAYEAYGRLPRYPALILGHFDPYAWAADPDRRTDVYRSGEHSAPGSRIRGFPGSAGTVEAVARVLDDPADGAELEVGEVLVTTVTNVGWTPLFPRAAAVVTDVGAPLSHAAIVARELGIPAVVGCGNATSLFRSGDRIRVDGSAGTVERIGP